MTTAIAIRTHEEIQPSTMAELKDLAKHAADSRFYGAESPAQALLVMMTAKDLGLSYTQGLRMFHNIEGKLALSADGAIALCLGHPEVCEYFRCTATTPDSSTWETKRKGSEPRTFTFTIAEAQAAGLVKQTSTGKPGMWQKWPARMCSARAKTFLARDVYPDLLAGLLSEDEAREIADERKPPMHIVQSAPRETPHDPDGVVVEGEEVRTADALRDAITSAEDAAALAKVATRIKGADISDAERLALRFVYNERKAALCQKTEEAKAPEPMREMGEEG